MGSKRRKVAVFTGSRSEYGLQYPVLRAIASEPRLEYLLLAGSGHLLGESGNTVEEITADGFEVSRSVEIEMGQDTLAGTVDAIGAGVRSIGRALTELQPDFLVVYGDRYESFAAVIASTQLRIATAHIEGGDYTEGGALDDGVRHAMTKLAHLHFATNEQSAERIRRMGEEPWRVFNVGLPALDLIVAGEFSPAAELAAALDLDISRPVLLFCQHSVTTEFEQSAQQVEPSLEAISVLALQGYQSIITFPNNDAGGKHIIEAIRRFQVLRLPGVRVVKSLGRRRFHGVLNLIGREGCGALVGNSSAGIKETPAFGCPTVNIGSRQQGRLRADNVLDVPYDSAAILTAARRCVEDESFRRQCQTCENPYGTGRSGSRIAEILATVPYGPLLVRKKMSY